LRIAQKFSTGIWGETEEPTSTRTGTVCRKRAEKRFGKGSREIDLKRRTETERMEWRNFEA